MLKSNRTLFRISALPLLGVLVATAMAQPPSDQRIIIDRPTSVASEYWIGVLAEPVNEALQSQLDVDEGLLVERVVPESPAADAGIERHDVLLRFGETALGRVQDLASAVADAGKTKQEVELIRQGKRRVVEATPAKRPMQEVDIHVSPQDHDRVNRWLREFEDRRNPLRLQLIRPGFTIPDDAIETAEGRLNLPENMSIVIRKEGDGPAEIKVTKGDDSWEVNEDSLEELPEDVRPHVQSILGGKGKTLELRTDQWRNAFSNDADGLRRQIEDWRARAPRGPGRGVRRLRVGPDQPANDLDETVEEMRIQLDRLKKQIDSIRAKEDSKDSPDRDP